MKQVQTNFPFVCLFKPFSKFLFCSFKVGKPTVKRKKQKGKNTPQKPKSRHPFLVSAQLHCDVSHTVIRSTELDRKQGLTISTHILAGIVQIQGKCFFLFVVVVAVSVAVVVVVAVVLVVVVIIIVVVVAVVVVDSRDELSPLQTSTSRLQLDCRTTNEPHC